MLRTVTTTISLPKTMAARLKSLSRREGRTTSELMREALRTYEQAVAVRHTSRVSWNTLREKLAEISLAGSTRDLATFIARDRQRR